MAVSSTFQYLTTTLPYVNAEPHIGFALEIIEADVLARFYRLQPAQVIFNTGTDEHGQKIWQQALATHEEPQAYCDRFAQSFAQLKSLLNLSYTHFIRTTNEHHQAAAQEFWRRCLAQGDIYKQIYDTKYCVGCELEKTDSELVDGKCPLHPNKEIELRSEENYFFRFSKYQQPLLDLYAQNPQFVLPASKMSEIQAFVQAGLKDFSISRLKAKMPWGIPVPNDDDHVMYVWFDALVNYISTLGWPDSNPDSDFSKFWPGIQLAGKDNLRQQAAMWQAMLLSANLPPSRQILINGFISVGGQKMSKSLGNVISPQEMVNKYGVDGTRFLLINLGTFGENMDVTWDRLDTEFVAALANGLGNLASRVAALATKLRLSGSTMNMPTTFAAEFSSLFANFQLTGALRWINQRIAQLDQLLSAKKPWTLSETEATPIITAALQEVTFIAFHLQPFMPETASKLLQHFSQNSIQKIEPLFPRLVSNS